MELILIVILIALIFEYINGFHDTANSIATVVSTKVLTPRQAVMLAAVTNLIGAMLGTAVAKTISSGLVDGKVVTVTSEMVVCALAGGILWNLLTWWFGMPSSSSHALIGGLCGAALAGSHDQWAAIIWSQPDPVNWYKGSGLLWKVIVPMFSSPMGGFILGFLIMGLLYAFITLLRLSPRIVNATFGKAQILSAASMGLMHGTNDAQKTMGIIALALMAGTTAGTFDNLPGFMRFLYCPEQGPAIYAAHNALGEMYRDGRGVPKDGKAAARHFEKAAKNKDMNAQFNLAQLYLGESGNGVKQNHAAAEELLKKAAEKGHYAAQTNLAYLYQHGGSMAKNLKAAERWAALAASNQPPSRQITFAARKLKGQPTNAVEAAAWLQARAEKKNADAQITLATFYLAGKGIEKNEARAVTLLTAAAQRRHPDALYNLGLLNLQGIGVPKNEAEAIHCFKQAAATEGIKLWIKVVCALVMAAGTAAGGWRIIKTLGHKMVKLQPVNGFAAETSSATMIFLATTLGIPVSTTHNISAAIMGVGSARRFSAIKWSVVERMVWAWVLTIPITGALAYLFVRLLQALGYMP
jgi:phosphate/sulfate permease